MGDLSKVGRDLRKHGINIGPDVLLTTHLSFEAGVSIYSETVLKHVELGAYSYINMGGAIGNARIGRYCSIGPNCSIGLDRHPLEWVSTSPFPYSNRGAAPEWQPFKSRFQFEGFPQPITIGHDVWIGTRVVVANNGPITIGTGSVIASGSVVTRDVPPYAVVVGAPATVIRYRFDEALRDALLASEWWEYDVPRYLRDNPNTSMPWDAPNRFIDWLSNGGRAALEGYKGFGAIKRVDFNPSDGGFTLSQ
jgi:acetyltransferase-like isoleucine patch superfamily enzyme